MFKKRQGEERGKKSNLREWAEAIAFAIILALVIRAFVVQAFKIPSGSMLPTLQVGDHILVNKFIFWFQGPQRGDIIVFRFPGDESRDFIKRVIGLPGEALEIRERRVFIDGKPLEEPYAVYTEPSLLDNPHPTRDNFGPVQIPEGHLFMMGDNRDHSADSRFWVRPSGEPAPFLEMKKIRGRAFLIYFSWRPDPDAPLIIWPSPARPLTLLQFPASVLRNLAYNLVHLHERVRWGRIGRQVR